MTMLMMMIPHWSSKAYDDPGLLSELGHHRHMLLIWVPWGGRKPDQTISHLRSCILDLSWFEQLIQQELKRAVSTSCGWKWGAPRGGGALKFFLYRQKCIAWMEILTLPKLTKLPFLNFGTLGGALWFLRANALKLLISLVGLAISLVWGHYHFRLVFEHFIKSTKKSCYV